MRAALLLVGVIACGAPSRDGSGGGIDGHGSGDSGGSHDGDIGSSGTTYVYAHTAHELYKIDPDTLARTLVGKFGWPNNSSDQMTDLAIDRNGNKIGVSIGTD